MSRLKKHIDQFGGPLVESFGMYLTVGFLEDRDRPFSIQLTERLCNVTVRNSNSSKYRDIINSIRYQLQEAVSKNQVSIKIIDNTWEDVKWKVGLSEDLAKSGIRQKVQAQYVEIFREGSRRYSEFQRKGLVDVFSYMKARRRYGDLASEFGYTEDFKPLVVLVNDGNMLDESSFLTHCKHFIREARSMGIYFIVCGGVAQSEEVPNLACDLDLTREWSVVATLEGYKKVYIEIPKF